MITVPRRNSAPLKAKPVPPLPTTQPHDRTVDVHSLKPGVRYRMWVESNRFKGRSLVHGDPITVPLAGVWLAFEGTDGDTVTVPAREDAAAWQASFIDETGTVVPLVDPQVTVTFKGADFTVGLNEPVLGIGQMVEADAGVYRFEVDTSASGSGDRLFFQVSGSKNNGLVHSRDLIVIVE